MTKKHFIALADIFRLPGEIPATLETVVRSVLPLDTPEELQRLLCARLLEGITVDLAHFCKAQNHHFDYDRWMGYIASECGPNGGKVRK